MQPLRRCASAHARGGDHCGRRSQLLAASRYRSDCDAARAEARRLRHRRVRRRGVNDFAAGRQAPAHNGRHRDDGAACRRRFARLSSRCASSIASPSASPGDLPEPGRLRQLRPPAPSARAAPISAARVDAHAGAGGVPGRAAAAAVRLQPLSNIACGAARQQSGARAHGRAGRAVVRPSAARRRPNSVGCRDTAPFAAPHFVEMVLAHAGDQPPARIADHARSRRCSAKSQGIIDSQRATAARARRARTSRSSCSTTRAANGWRGRDRATTATPSTAARSTAPIVAAAAGIRAEAVHLRARIRAGLRTRRPCSPDMPSHFPTAEPGVLYSPRNYDGQYRGPLLARRALAGSENVPAVALASDIGVQHAAALPRHAPA